MGIYTGTVRRNELEGGFLELFTDDGSTYRLQGGTAPINARVRVHGSVDHGGFGIQMSGPSLKVDKIEEL